MQKEEIEITIHPDGRLEYIIKGVKGGACASISALLEQLGKVERQEHTGEFYEQETDAHLTLAQR